MVFSGLSIGGICKGSLDPGRLACIPMTCGCIWLEMINIRWAEPTGGGGVCQGSFRV